MRRLLVFFCGLVMQAAANAQDYAPDARVTDYVRSLQLFDAHRHLNKDMTTESMLSWMDKAGVRRMVLMPRHYSDDGFANDEMAAALVDRYPDRFVAFVGGQRDDLIKPSVWNGNGPYGGFLDGVKAKLATGKFRGLGEYILLHYGYNKYVSTTNQNSTGDEQLAADTPLMLRLAEIAGQFHVPVTIHAEAEPAEAEQVRHLIEHARSTTIIWAHNCGRASAERTAAFLAAYPNLLCDLGGMAVPWPRAFGWGTFNTKAGQDYKPNSHIVRVQNNDGTLDSTMRDLFNHFPDRFMIGTDIAHPFQYNRYGDMVEAFRRMLSQLDLAAAHKIGNDNAEALFGPSRR